MRLPTHSMRFGTSSTTSEMAAKLTNNGEFGTVNLWGLAVCGRKNFGWCPGTELNRRHADFQSAALPTELPGPEEGGEKSAENTTRKRGCKCRHPAVHSGASDPESGHPACSRRASSPGGGFWGTGRGCRRDPEVVRLHGNHRRARRHGGSRWDTRSPWGTTACGRGRGWQARGEGRRRGRGWRWRTATSPPARR